MSLPIRDPDAIDVLLQATSTGVSVYASEAGGQLFLYRELSLNEVTACQRLHEDGILAEGHLEEAIIRRALLWPEHSNPSDPSDYYFSKLPAGVPTQLAQAILSASDPRIRPVGTDSDENPLENELLLATNKWEQDPFGKEINAVMELIPGLQPSVLRQLSIRQLYDLLALHQLISSQTEKTPSRTATPLPDIPNPLANSGRLSSELQQALVHSQKTLADEIKRHTGKTPKQLQGQKSP